MALWDKLFGKTPSKKPERSPYLPFEEDPTDISFAKNFTAKGGHFLYSDKPSQINVNFEHICTENQWQTTAIVSVDKSLSNGFQTTYVEQTTGRFKAFSAALIYCEYLIGNTGKILLSEHQIKHIKLSELPPTVIVIAKTNQIVRDVSQGMSLLKNKYGKNIPTNITTLKTTALEENTNNDIAEQNTSSKNIYLLLEDVLDL